MITKMEHLLEIPDYLKRLSSIRGAHQETQSSGFIVVADPILVSKFPKFMREFQDPSFEWIDLAHPPPFKSLHGFQELAEAILAKGLRKDSIIVAIGGGSLTDLVGFTASVLLRGVAWISIPTTYLAMIDASIGGKTGLDTKYGKNLIGTFHMPIDTLICAEFLSTLDPLEIASGHGELIKYALLSKEIQEKIEERKHLSDIIYAAAKYKSDVVERDFLDVNERRFLNLGHTLGHAFEVHFNLRHGEAIVWGLYWEHYIMDLTLVAAKVLDLAGILGLSLTPKITIAEFQHFWKYVAQDKKIGPHQILELPLVDENGHGIKVKIPLDDFYEKIEMHAMNLFA